MKIGIDLVDLVEFTSIVKVTPKIVDRLFSQREQELDLTQLAGNFALKECLIKTFPEEKKFRYVDFEILRDSNGKPIPHYTGSLTEMLRNWDIELSITNKANAVIGMLIRFKNTTCSFCEKC
jgi:phosphopantetheine--protein transferase-like protein